MWFEEIEDLALRTAVRKADHFDDSLIFDVAACVAGVTL